MNGIHDMGGMHGMGPIRHEADEAVFHEVWEGRMHAISRAIGAWGRWSLDTARHAVELIPPADYLRMSYYERFLATCIRLLVRHGLVTEQEIETGKPRPDRTRRRRLSPRPLCRQSLSAARVTGGNRME